MKKWLFILPVLVLILVLFLLVGHPTKVKQINKPFYMLATNIQQPAFVGSQVDYFTGASFAKFNPATGHSQLLSDYFYTRGAITVSSWSENAVVFSTAGTVDGDTFGQVLLKAGRSSAASAWWRYDFSNRQLELLNFKSAASCNNINEVGTSLWCFAPDNGSAHASILYSYNLNTHAQKEALHISSPVKSISAVGSSLYYLTTDLAGAQTLHSYNTIPGSEAVIYTSSQQLNYATNGRLVLLDELPIANGSVTSASQEKAPANSSPKGNQLLQLLDVPTRKSKKMKIPVGAGQFTDVNGNLVFTLPDSHFYVAGSNDITPYLIDGPNVSSAWQISGTTYYLDSGNNLFANRRLPVLKNPTNFIEKENVSPNNFYINVFSGTSNTVYLNNAAKTFTGNAADVASFLAAKGYDPGQFNFDWQILSAADAAGITSNSVVLN